MNVKLMIQKAREQSNPLYMLFLVIKKTYDTLDRTRTLHLLHTATVRRILQTILNRDTMTTKQNNYFGLKVEIGVKQGDIVSSTIFKIIINCVFRDTEEKM
jgi:Reverse transcriptase (RNA-dependent DNA polymerase)